MSLVDTITDEELQEYIYLANIVACYVEVKPEHPCFGGMREDIKKCLVRIKNPRETLRGTGAI